MGVSIICGQSLCLNLAIAVFLDFSPYSKLLYKYMGSPCKQKLEYFLKYFKMSRIFEISEGNLCHVHLHTICSLSSSPYCMPIVATINIIF